MNKKCFWVVFAVNFLFPAVIFSQQGVNKLIALLVNPMMAGSVGQFTQGEEVVTTKALLRVVDVTSSNNSYSYLVAINDNNVPTPFYIIANRRLELMDLQFRNTIFEDLLLEYSGKAEYYSNRVPRETFVFKLSSREAGSQTQKLNSAEAYLNRGIEYHNKRDYDRAISDYTQAIQLNPNYARAFLNRGLAYNEKKDYARAEVDYTKAIQLSSTVEEQAGAYFGRGVVFYDNKEYDRAIADYSQAIRLDPNRAGAAYLNRGIAYNEKGDYDHAILDYEAVLNISPNNSNAKSRLEQAKKQRDSQAPKLDGSSALSYNRSGLEYFNKKDYNRAITEFSQAIRLNANYAEAFNNRGNAYFAKFDYDLAIADYTQAIRLEPNNAEAYSNRGNAYSYNSDYALAIADLDQAIRLDPNNADAYSRRALAYWGMGARATSNPKVLVSNPNTGKTDYDRAIADYTQAIRLEPNNAEAYDDRGKVFAQRGNIYRDKSDYDKAIADFETALRLDPKIDKFSLELTKKWRDTNTFRTP